MTVTKPESKKLLKSAGIGLGGVLVVLGLKLIFPDFDWAQMETAVLTAISAWVVNTIRMSLSE